jgi:cell division septum initiation protein DivIVA
MRIFKERKVHMDFHISCLGYNKYEVERYIGYLQSANYEMKEENKKLYEQLQKVLESLETTQVELAVKEQILKCYSKCDKVES